MAQRSVDKVVAYVIDNQRLLILAHPMHPAVGLQVPAGTVESGESPTAAVLRELREETGLSEFGTPEYLGVDDFDMSTFGRAETHHRHFFRVPLAQPAPERWRHIETSGGTAAPEIFEFHWVALATVPPLAAGQGAFIDALQPAA